MDMTQDFWHQLPRPFFVLAPMEAVTDTVFRHVIAQAAAPDVWFSEFTNATGWVHAGDKAIGSRLIKTDDEQPIVAQLWGADPEAMGQLARHCAELGYHGLDLNTGCPDSHAIHSGGGAALIKNPALTAELITALKTAGLPVSVKCRLGYSRVDEWEDWIEHLLRQDISVLSVHLRSKKEMSKVDAHWEIMPQIIALRDRIAPRTLIVGNGDVRDRAHGEQLARESGCDGVMIGRGIFTQPYAFSNDPTPRSREELISLLELQLDLHDRASELYGPRKFDPLKRFFKIYLRDFEGASDLRASLMLTRDSREVRSILSQWRITQTGIPQSQRPSHLAAADYSTKKQPETRAIVFDSDGTLLDTRRFIYEGYATVLEQHGLSELADEEYIRSHLGQPVPQTFRHLLGPSVTEQDISSFAHELNVVQDGLTRLIKPYPHVARLLTAWKAQGIKLCLFTSGDNAMITRNFAAAGLGDPSRLFDAIVTADDNLPHKPAPDAISHLLHRIGVPAEHAIVVGDHPYDLQAATAARVRATIGITHGIGSEQELRDAGADTIAHGLEDVKAVATRVGGSAGAASRQ